MAHKSFVLHMQSHVISGEILWVDMWLLDTPQASGRTLKADMEATICIFDYIGRASGLDVGLTNVLVPNIQVVSLVTYGCYGQKSHRYGNTRIEQTLNNEA